MEKNQKYQLEDYYSILRSLYDDRVQIDMVTNKLGQPSVRVHYEASKLKVFDLFVLNPALLFAINQIKELSAMSIFHLNKQSSFVKPHLIGG